MLSIGDITSIISSIAILIAIIQLIREVKDQNVSNFFYLHEYLSQEVFSEARVQVRKHLYKKDYALWTDEDKQYANRVCSSYDQAGILIDSNILNKKTKEAFLGSSWGQSIIDQYETLLPYLEDKQTPHQSGKQFFKHFTSLYEETKRIQGY